jgi:hypothetical protein
MVNAVGSIKNASDEMVSYQLKVSIVSKSFGKFT